MKRIALLGLVLVLAVPALAQRRGFVGTHHGFGGRSFGHGFGNVVFPGSGGPPRHPFSITDTGFARRLGGIVSGFRPFTGAPRAGRFVGRSRPVLVPVAYPVFIGGFGYYPDPRLQQTPNVTIVNPPPQAPQIIINQTFGPETATPAVREYISQSPRKPSVSVYQAPSAQPVESAGVEAQPTIYLIAFTDGSIQAALGYWLDGDTLHYITAQGSLNKASAELVDRQFSEQLNRERNVEFRLSVPK
jgi:hypothetical protein